MRVLGNGLVEITNSTTGEKKQIHPEELGGYSPFLAKQYTDYLANQKKAGTGTIDPSTYLNTLNTPSTPSISQDTAGGDSGFFNFNPTQSTTPSFQGSNPNLFNNNVTTPGGVSIPSVPTNSRANIPQTPMYNPVQGLDMSSIELSPTGQFQIKKPKGLSIGGF